MCARNGLRLAAEHRAGTGRRGTAPSRPALAPRTKCARVTTTHNGQPPGASPADTPQREPRRGAGTPAHGGPRSDVAIADRRGYADVGRITHRGSPPAPDIEPRGDSRTADDRRAARPALICPDRWAARARARVSAHRPARNHRHRPSHPSSHAPRPRDMRDTAANPRCIRNPDYRDIRFIIAVVSSPAYIANAIILIPY